MNRRDFLVRSSMLAAAGLSTRSVSAQPSAAGARPPTAAPAPAPAVPEFFPLRRDVGYFSARGGSIGWLVNKDALACVDTQFADTAALFLRGLPGRNDRPLDLVINSHHHGDHTGGNGVMKPVAKMIVAHANVPELQRSRAERDNTLDRQTYPDTTFPQTWKKDLGGETVSAKYFGAAHTKGDIVTHFEKANVIHMGDLMFNRLYPFVDRPGGASIRNWVTVLETVAKEYPADAIYIFGHGNATFGVRGKRGDLLVFRDYLSALLEHTQKRIAAGEPKERILGLENLPGFTDFHLPPGPQNRMPMNLSAAYDELTQKSG